jgi:hypothetical protein
MSVHYDPSIITKHAQALYNRASGIIFLGGLLAFLAGAAMGGATQGGGFIVLMGGLVGALIGVVIGRGRAFSLQLQAQVALCQVATEANTRRAADAATAALAPAAPNQMTRSA